MRVKRINWDDHPGLMVQQYAILFAALFPCGVEKAIKYNSYGEGAPSKTWLPNPTEDMQFQLEGWAVFHYIGATMCVELYEEKQEAGVFFKIRNSSSRKSSTSPLGQEGKGVYSRVRCREELKRYLAYLRMSYVENRPKKEENDDG